MEKIQVTITFSTPEEVAEFFKNRDFSEVKAVSKVVSKVSHLDDTPPGTRHDRVKAYRKELLEIVRTAGTAGATPKEVFLRLPDWAMRQSKNSAYHSNHLSLLFRKRKLKREHVPGEASKSYRYFSLEAFREKNSRKENPAVDTPPKKTWTGPKRRENVSRAIREAALLMLDDVKEKGATKSDILQLLNPGLKKRMSFGLPTLVLTDMAKKGLVRKVTDMVEGKKLGTGVVNRYWLPQYFSEGRDTA